LVSHRPDFTNIGGLGFATWITMLAKLSRLSGCPTRQGTAYCVPEHRVGRTVHVALLRPPLVTSDLFGLSCSSFVIHAADATYGQ
jgi:hypothetical protein